MDKQELNSLLICEIEKLGVVYRLGDLDNQKAFISLELGFGAYTELARPFDLVRVCDFRQVYRLID